jgi:tryptophan synthase beta chain
MTTDTAETGQRFGAYGGRYVPETLMRALDELTEAYEAAREDAEFQAALAALLKDFAGRPTPLYRARRLGEAAGHPTVFLKREDLNHTGAHKINNTLGQALLAARMGKRRIIAETGAGQHGVATATACALFDLECVVYMGEEDVKRQALNVYRMELLGAEVRAGRVGHAHAQGRDQRGDPRLGDERRRHALHHRLRRGARSVPAYGARLPSRHRTGGPRADPGGRGEAPGRRRGVRGGGSNAIGIFHEFIPDESVQLIGVEAAGEGIESGRHSASLAAGRPGVLHGSLSYLLQDADGQVAPAHSVSAGLDYPGVGPEHSYLRDTQRARYTFVTDDEALDAFHRLSELEGIIPALESAHAVAHVLRHGPDYDGPIVVCLSGRGDKDVAHVARLEGRGSLL